MQALTELKRDQIIQKIHIIPKSSEKFLSIIIDDKIKLIDSMAIASSSLEKLVETMNKDEYNFPITRETFNNGI